MSAEIQAVRNRWEGFLAKLRDRAEEILAEAQPGCMAVFESSGFDPFAMSNVLPALRARFHELSSKAQDTWFAQVDGSFEKAGLEGREAFDVEYEKMRETQQWLDFRYEDFEVRIKADASRIIWARLSKHLPTQMNCTQCGSNIPLPLTFMSLNLSCPSCRSVNTFEPGEARILHSFAIPCLAHEEKWEERHGLEKLFKPPLLRENPTYVKELGNWDWRYAQADS